jgi:hypothetical protein
MHMTFYLFIEVCSKKGTPQGSHKIGACINHLKKQNKKRFILIFWRGVTSPNTINIPNIKVLSLIHNKCVVLSSNLIKNELKPRLIIDRREYIFHNPTLHNMITPLCLADNIRASYILCSSCKLMCRLIFQVLLHDIQTT